MTVENNTRLMAPWFRDLQQIASDGVVTKAEARTKIVPWADHIHDKSDAYAQRISELVKGAIDFPAQARATAPAQNLVKMVQAEPKSVAERFSPSVTDVGFSYGPGVVGPMAGTGPAVTMTAQFPYIDVKATTRYEVDEKRHRVTVYLEGTSSGTIHPMVMTRPLDISVPVKRPKDLGARYTIVVKDGNVSSPSFGNTVAKGEFVNNLPM